MCDIGEGQRGQSNKTAPDHPAKALIIRRRLLGASRQKDGQRTCGYGESTQDSCPRDRLSRCAKDIGAGEGKHNRQHDGDRGQGPFDRPPARRAFVFGRPQGKQQEAGQAGPLRYGAGQVLRQQGGRRGLQPRIILVRLPGSNQMT